MVNTTPSKKIGDFHAPGMGMDSFILAICALVTKIFHGEINDATTDHQQHKWHVIWLAQRLEEGFH